MERNRGWTEYSSVQVSVVEPPNANASFCVPAPPRASLATFSLLPRDHDIPSYSSVQLTVVGVAPPNAKPAF